MGENVSEFGGMGVVFGATGHLKPLPIALRLGGQNKIRESKRELK